jgi:hypothetical protein
MLTRSVFLLVLLGRFFVEMSDGFVISLSSPSVTTASTRTTSLLGRKVKRGRLGNIVDEEVIDSTGSGINKRRKKSTTTTTAANKKGKKDTVSSGSISPALADFFTQEQRQTSIKTDTVEADGDYEDDDEVSFEQFDLDDDDSTTTTTSSSSKGKNDSKRRQKQSVRNELEEVRNSKIDTIIDRLEEVLEQRSGNVEDILVIVDELLQLTPSTASNNGGNIRQLVAGKRRLDYRLAWAGSDEAICHVGTGLHKVPLARLQEVFMSCLGRNRLEILEVIRLLGPFPNVKNVLLGTTKVSNKDNMMHIVMDSMLDGTGKEILAGTEDNIRRVDLHMEFCDERAIVAVVPPEDGTTRSSPLEENGKHVLVFVKENDLDEKLDSLRVS